MVIRDVIRVYSMGIFTYSSVLLIFIVYDYHNNLILYAFLEYQIIATVFLFLMMYNMPIQLGNKFAHSVFTHIFSMLL